MRAKEALLSTTNVRGGSTRYRWCFRGAQTMPTQSQSTARRKSTVTHKPDPLDDAVPLSDRAGVACMQDEPREPRKSIRPASHVDVDGRNATGGALPASDDEDNDNDNDDARERAIPDHLVRDEDE
jgi:hypothetical protein